MDFPSWWRLFEARRLVFSVYHDKGQILAQFNQRKLVSIWWAGYRNHSSIQLLCHPQNTRHCYHKWQSQPNTYNHVLCTEVESHYCTNRQTISITYHHSSRQPRFKGWLGQIPGQSEIWLPSKPDLSNELPIDVCVKKISNTLSKALSESHPKCRPRDEPRPPTQALILNAILLKDQLRKQWHITRDPALKAEVNRLQRRVTHHLT